MFLCAPEAVSLSLKETPQAQVQRFSLTHICCVILGSEETPGFFFIIIIVAAHSWGRLFHL